MCCYAFEEYKFQAKTFSRTDMGALRAMLAVYRLDHATEAADPNLKRVLEKAGI